MKNDLKKIIAVHDLSGFGRCAFTVIIPTLSVMGFQVCPIPTAVLSTHTGGYQGFTFRDLTDDLSAYFDHFFTLGVDFHSFYSGFLGNESQIEKVGRMIERTSGSMLVMVDPVMGDGGVLYSTYSEEMRAGMKKLVRKAHVITPNITEAAFLLDEEPKSSYSDADVARMLTQLSRICDGRTVITGIEREDSVVSAFTEDGGITYGTVINPKVEKEYPGTGDIFSSVLLGGLLSGASFADAVFKASDFVKEVMVYSAGFDYPEREGVLLERKLSLLVPKSESNT